MEVQLIYNVVLISAVRQNDTYIRSFFIVPSIMVYPRRLDIIPCVLQ